METAKIEDIASLLEQTGHAHHQAFINTDGADPEWALWYAVALEKPLSKILDRPLTQSRIVYELVRLDETADTSDTTWPIAYARELVAQYG
jgi:NAD(P)H-hydrate epimerase